MNIEQLSRDVEDGLMSPLAVVAELAAQSDGELLRLDAGGALSVIEVTRAAVAALEAVQALAIEAFARREDEAVAALRSSRRSGGPLGLKGDEATTASLAPVFRVAPRVMGNLLCDVRVLVNDLPETFALVRAGRLDLTRARIVADAGLDVARSLRASFDEAMRHPGQHRWRLGLPDISAPSLRKRAARVAMEVDPKSAEEAAAMALRDRCVRVRPGGAPGTSTWSAFLPSDDSLLMWAAIDELASQYLQVDWSLTADQARADALTALVLHQVTVVTTVDLTVPLLALPGEGGAPAVADPTCGGAPEGVSPVSGAEPPDAVTAAVARRRLMRLIGGSAGGHMGRDPDEGDRVGTGGTHLSRPAFLPLPVALSSPAAPPSLASPQDSGMSWVTGLAPVGVQHTRVGILLTEVVTRWLADPDTRVRLHGCDPRTGALVVHDPTTYRPGKRLARMVRVRDGHCRFPGCTTEVRRCQIDHVVPFPEGRTTIDNLACLCVTHHRFKTHAAWGYELEPDGTCTWISPLGRRYVTVPDLPRDLAA